MKLNKIAPKDDDHKKEKSNAEPKVSYFSLYRFATTADLLLIRLGGYAIVLSNVGLIVLTPFFNSSSIEIPIKTYFEKKKFETALNSNLESRPWTELVPPPIRLDMFYCCWCITAGLDDNLWSNTR